MTVDVIIPTKGLPHLIDCVVSLKHLPFPITLDVVREGSNWAEAVNIGLDRKSASDNDILIMDDDVVLLSETFRSFSMWKSEADIFGFKLLFPDMTIQHAGGYIRRDGMTHVGFKKSENEFSFPMMCAHVTASLIYIKKHVFQKIGKFTEMPGLQFEDVDFNLRALKDGFKILYLPTKAIHKETATKKEDPKFHERMAQNMDIVINKHLMDKAFLDMLDAFPHAYYR
jgi:GT2 family glycosyltransferase